MGQTTGLIFQSGGAPFDPNTDGYVSSWITGFTGDGYDVDEFEFTMHPLPVLGQGEIEGYVSGGPTCGFTDLVADSNGATEYMAMDASNNLIFRFRLGSFIIYR